MKKILSLFLAIVLIFGLFPVQTITAYANTSAFTIQATTSAHKDSSYSLALTSIFEDADEDSLTFKVSVNGAEEITAAKNYKYIPAEAGTYTLVFKANDGKADSADTYTVTITSEAALQSWGGNGTAEDPYLLKTAEDLKILSALCEGGNTYSGKYFKIDAEESITLPANWVPIGTTGSNFAGNIDGNGKLIVVPEGEKALIGVPLGATLKNLNIYGKKINGNGVVAIYTTGLSGTAITIENVTLKSGTTTTGSGFIGGYASGSYPVIIRNCTVESGVTIGDGTQSNIGSFGGEYNGIIVGCKSSATVKGVNYVGGISGNKGQTIGEYFIVDCIFDGTVIATGDNVGGISGGGYAGTSFGLASAPNAPCASIINCLVSGSITGKDNVGGILGSEPGVKECWNNGTGYIQNNLFTGTISAAGTNKGGIIGYFSTINKMNVISGNFYLDTCGADKGIGGGTVEDTTAAGSFGTGWNKYTLSGKKWGRDDDPLGAGADNLAKSVTATELSNGTVLSALNSGKNSSGNWTAGATAPTFTPYGTEHVIRISNTALSTMNGVSQEANGSDILSGKKLTVLYNTGKTEEVETSASGVTKDYAEKITAENRGNFILASVFYENHQLAFNLGITNTLPTLKEGVEDTEKQIAVNNTYVTADLKTIFEDKDGDSLTYKITYKDPTTNNKFKTLESAYPGGTFSYTVSNVGTTVLKIKANDGTKDSTQSYQVTLNVVEGPVISGMTAAKTDSVSGLTGTVSFNAGDSGTVYYLATDTDSAAPTAEYLYANGKTDSVSAAGAASVPVTFSKDKAQKLYAVLKSADGLGTVVSTDIAKVISVSVGIYDYNAESKVSTNGKIFENSAMTVAEGSTAANMLKHLFELEPTLGGEITASSYGSYLSKVGTLSNGWCVGYQVKGGSFDDYSNSGIDYVTLHDGDRVSVDWSQNGGYIDNDYNKYWNDVGNVWGGYPYITSFKIDGKTAAITTAGKAGTEASPYTILVGADSTTGKTAEIVSNFGEHYRVISPDLTSAADYTNPVSFYISNLGGSAKTYYVVTVDATAPTISSAKFTQTKNEAAKGTITVAASDANGIASVKVTSDGYEKTLTAAPYTFDVTKAGSYTVTVTDGVGNTSTQDVTAAFVTVTSIAVSAKDNLSTELSDGVLNMVLGGTNSEFELKSVLNPVTDVYTVLWSSSMPNVAKIDQNGKVTAAGAGVAMITATAGGKNATVLVEVTKAGAATVNDAANIENIVDYVADGATKEQIDAVIGAVQNMTDSEKEKLSDETIAKLDEAAKKGIEVNVKVEASVSENVPNADRIGESGHSAVGLIAATGKDAAALDGKTITLKVAQKKAEEKMEYSFELELDLGGDKLELASPVIITIQMPEGYVHDSSYRVKHTLNNGTVEWLALTYNKEANTVSFRANRFSVFSIGNMPTSGTGIVHVIGGSSNPSVEENPNTGYEAPVEIFFAVSMLVAAAAVSFGKKRR